MHTIKSVKTIFSKASYHFRYTCCVPHLPVAAQCMWGYWKHLHDCRNNKFLIKTDQSPNSCSLSNVHLVLGCCHTCHSSSKWNENCSPSEKFHIWLTNFTEALKYLTYSYLYISPPRIYLASEGSCRYYSSCCMQPTSRAWCNNPLWGQPVPSTSQKVGRGPEPSVTLRLQPVETGAQHQAGTVQPIEAELEFGPDKKEA